MVATKLLRDMMECKKNINKMAKLKFKEKKHLEICTILLTDKSWQKQLDERQKKKKQYFLKIKHKVLFQKNETTKMTMSYV